MSPVSILYVIGSLDVGGAEKHLVQIVLGLDRDRWNPIVCCLTERGKLAEGLDAVGIQVVCRPTAPHPRSASRIRRLAGFLETIFWLITIMRRYRPTIAHFFLPGAYILGAPASILARIPVRIMSRRSLNNYQRSMRFGTAIERGLHGYMTTILGNSTRVVCQLQTDEHISKDRLGLIYNGVDCNQYRRSLTARNEVRTSLNIPQNALVFITVANLIPYKGHHDLFAAFSMALTQLPHGWRLLVVGRDDGIGAKLQKHAATLQISNSVHFLGSRSDIPDLLSCADISILPSHEEGFSNAILESMAAGLPVIATDVGGNREAIVDGETGVIVPPRNPKRMSEAIACLATDEQLRARMSTIAVDHVKMKFELSTCLSQYEQLYEGLLQGKRPAEIDSIRVK